MVGLLMKHMYGTRAAAMGWHSEYSGTLVDLGFVPGLASACVFYHQERRLMCSATSLRRLMLSCESLSSTDSPVIIVSRFIQM